MSFRWRPGIPPGLVAMWEEHDQGRLGLELYFTGPPKICWVSGRPNMIVWSAPGVPSMDAGRPKRGRRPKGSSSMAA
jgi:hypothetical protein